MGHDRRRFLEAALGTAGALMMRPQTAVGAGGTPAAMAAALAALSAALGSKGVALAFPFAGEERLDWAFVPRSRQGVPFGQMDEAQLAAAHSVLKTGLSARGYEKATTIVSLEDVLREVEGRDYRDRGLYYFRFFGAAGGREPWGWSFEGHHVSLNYTVVGDRVASTPSFFGANPAEVRHGARRGTRALAREESLARDLLGSLDAAQARTAVIAEQAPADILSGDLRQATPLQPAGLPASGLSGRQRELLMALLREYTDNVPGDVAARRLETVHRGGVPTVHFAWAGGREPGQAHYYRLQGPGFLVEYDNIQNGANHAHTVWRDFAGDFGRDLLAEHHREGHQRG